MLEGKKHVTSVVQQEPQDLGIIWRLITITGECVFLDSGVCHSQLPEPKPPTSLR